MDKGSCAVLKHNVNTSRNATTLRVKAVYLDNKLLAKKYFGGLKRISTGALSAMTLYKNGLSERSRGVIMTKKTQYKLKRLPFSPRLRDRRHETPMRGDMNC
jgi:hypothetical protein